MMSLLIIITIIIIVVVVHIVNLDALSVVVVPILDLAIHWPWISPSSSVRWLLVVVVHVVIAVHDSSSILVHIVHAVLVVHIVIWDSMILQSSSFLVIRIVLSLTVLVHVAVHVVSNLF